ncbi:Golgin-84 [Acorus calamus]|uniref:Golgin-84 n=1 Tax=Acorus calamus TaxID=4465 RepID=A0AAV9CJN5_ACOCL|nr:Golgin-84 [Acorus calamus]
MASWLKVAEDLLEVVDRRAKLVAGPDEQPGTQSSVSNGQEFESGRMKSKDKGKLKPLNLGHPKASVAEKVQTGIQASLADVATDKDEPLPSGDSVTVSSDRSTNEPSAELLSELSKDVTVSGDALMEVPQNDGLEQGDNVVAEVSIADIKDHAVTSTDGDANMENVGDGLENSSSSAVITTTVDSLNGGEYSHDVNPKSKLEDENASLKSEQDRHQSESVETQNSSSVQQSDRDVLPEPSQTAPKHEAKSDVSNMGVQDQLDEAQGLLKSAVSTGQSKEARLARVCAGLSSRLQEYKSENAQLDKLLVAERELSNSYEARVKQLQQDLSDSRVEVSRVESIMADALAAKNSEIEALVSSMDALKKQAAGAEEKLTSLQANMETVMRGRELSETRMMQALREELASAERRAEEERTVHNATKMAAVEREVELEHRAVEASSALARIQRTADESVSRANELEHKVAVLEAECASLSQELQDMEARVRRGQKKPPEEANLTLQMQAWKDEAERARQGQREAEYKFSSLEAELQKMRVEMAGMKRDAEHYSRHEHMELEKRYRELTDLLYHKQTQLEAMASEKAAAEFQLEKEMKRHQEAQVEAERSRISRRASSAWEEDTDLRALDPLPLRHRHMAAASVQLQKAAKILDSGAVRATRFLWRYPIARLILLFYLVFVHLFLMYLLHRLQEQATDFAAKELAESMGLTNSSLLP